MVQFSKIAHSQVHHLCIHGEPKTGKSTLAASLAELGWNLKWLSVDNGHSILHKLSPAAQERVDLITIPDTATFPVGMDTFWKCSSGLPGSVCNQHGQFNCSVCRSQKLEGPENWTPVSFNTLSPNRDIVVFDNITACAESAMNFIMHKRKEGEVPGWDEFRAQGIMMNKFLLNLQVAKFNVIAIAQPTQSKLEDGTVSYVPCIGTGPFSGSHNAGQYFDSVIFMNTLNGTHRAGSKSTYKNGVVTGSRIDVAIEDMKVPSLATFFPILKIGGPEIVTAINPSIVEHDATIQVVSSNTVSERVVPDNPTDSSLPNSHVDTVSSNSPEPTTTQLTPQLTPAEQAKAKLAALRAKMHQGK